MAMIDPAFSAEEEEAMEMMEKAKSMTQEVQNELCVLHTQMLVWMMRRMLKERKGLGALALEKLPWPVSFLIGLAYLVLTGMGVLRLPGQ
jgi:hypothetical protein